jgi:hypothetical protein
LGTVICPRSETTVFILPRYDFIRRCKATIFAALGCRRGSRSASGTVRWIGRRAAAAFAPAHSRRAAGAHFRRVPRARAGDP